MSEGNQPWGEKFALLRKDSETTQRLWRGRGRRIERADSDVAKIWRLHESHGQLLLKDLLGGVRRHVKSEETGVGLRHVICRLAGQHQLDFGGNGTCEMA